MTTGIGKPPLLVRWARLSHTEGALLDPGGCEGFRRFEDQRDAESYSVRILGQISQVHAAALMIPRRRGLIVEVTESDMLAGGATPCRSA